MPVSSGSETSQSIGYVDVPMAGTWTVDVFGEASSFAESNLLKIFGFIVGSFAFCLLFDGNGIILIVIGVARLAQGES